MKIEPLEQILVWLMEGRVDFAEIASVYVRLLEQKEEKNRKMRS